MAVSNSIYESTREEFPDHPGDIDDLLDYFNEEVPTAVGFEVFEVEESDLEEGEIGEDGELEESLDRSVATTSDSFQAWLRSVTMSYRQFSSDSEFSLVTAHYRHNNFSPGFGGEQDYSSGGDDNDEVEEADEEEYEYEQDDSEDIDNEDDQDWESAE